MNDIIKGGKPLNNVLDCKSIIAYDALKNNLSTVLSINRFVPVDVNLKDGKKYAKFPLDWTNKTFDRWDTSNSVAVKTGNGIIVIDIDTKDLSLLDSNVQKFVQDRLELKDTFIVETTNGYHLYFKTDKEWSNNVKVSPYIDIRADGGCAFISSQVEGLTYSLYSDSEIAELRSFLEKLLKEKKYATSYRYDENGIKVNTVGRKKANKALFRAIASGDIHRIIKSTGMSKEDFAEGQMYVNFNKFAFILANEPSVKNEDVESILRLLVEEVLGFDWDSVETRKRVSISLRNMIWAPEYFEPEPMQIFLYGNEYYIVNDNYLYEKLNKGTAKVHWLKDGNAEEDLFNELKIVKDIDYQVDFFKPSSYTYDKTKKLIKAQINPTEEWNIPDTIDQEVIEDFEFQIMDGQLQELIRLIIWSMKLGENKLNKLLLVAASNKGKTKLMELMGFIYFTPPMFKKALTGEGTGTGISEESAENLKRSGLLLADDINEVPLEIKNVSDTLLAPVYRQGAIKLPVKFLVMTSTHDSYISAMSDELKNRILVLKIAGTYTFDKSPLWQKNRKHYEEQSQLYIKKLILEAIENSPTDEEFLTLQQKFKAPDNNERDETLDIVKELIEKAIVSDLSNNFIAHDEMYCVKNKASLKKLIQTIVKEEFADQKIDIAKEVSLLMDYYINKDRKSINIHGQSVKHYPINLKYDSAFKDLNKSDEL